MNLDIYYVWLIFTLIVTLGGHFFCTCPRAIPFEILSVGIEGGNFVNPSPHISIFGFLSTRTSVFSPERTPNTPWCHTDRRTDRQIHRRDRFYTLDRWRSREICHAFPCSRDISMGCHALPPGGSILMITGSSGWQLQSSDTWHYSKYWHEMSYPSYFISADLRCIMLKQISWYVGKLKHKCH